MTKAAAERRSIPLAIGELTEDEILAIEKPVILYKIYQVGNKIHKIKFMPPFGVIASSSKGNTHIEDSKGNTHIEDSKGQVVRIITGMGKSHIFDNYFLAFGHLTRLQLAKKND